ncbi:hypothetical protein LX36DRAFT_114001 [Colletotrichum falcatum]|nr:hypothetical protein LX36DRAFT_114001 [Colletotrichum falcatum]
MVCLQVGRVTTQGRYMIYYLPTTRYLVCCREASPLAWSLLTPLLWLACCPQQGAACRPASFACYPGRGMIPKLLALMSQGSPSGTGILPTRRTTLGALERRRSRTLAPSDHPPSCEMVRDARKRGSPAALSSLGDADVSRFPSCPLVLESIQPRLLPPAHPPLETLPRVSRRDRACLGLDKG